ncbi:MAG: Maf family protein [Oscillospiraceae bacterium]|nr:Maf family protein [Oscillospiraceae bacterium]
MINQQNRKIVLASNSSRRRELLEMLGLEFTVIPDTSAEVIDLDLTPEQAVCKLAVKKAVNVSRLVSNCDTMQDALLLFPESEKQDATLPFRVQKNTKQDAQDAIIIAADTVVYLDGKPIEKPMDAADAVDMLQKLSGRRHTVYTGVCVLAGSIRSFGAEATDVYFRELSHEEILRYVKTGEPMDKAGAYGAQGRGALLVERIDGDFFNVMGLPLARLSDMLKSFGIIL